MGQQGFVPQARLRKKETAARIRNTTNTIQAMLLATPGAALLDWSLEVESSTLALLRFLIDVRTCADLPDDAAIEAQLVDLLRGWNEAVATQLAAFEEEGRPKGSVLDATTGQRFWSEILAVGASRPAAESFRAFRGREPRIDALLRHNGLMEEPARS